MSLWAPEKCNSNLETFWRLNDNTINEMSYESLMEKDPINMPV